MVDCIVFVNKECAITLFIQDNSLLFEKEKDEHFGRSAVKDFFLHEMWILLPR